MFDGSDVKCSEESEVESRDVIVRVAQHEQ